MNLAITTTSIKVALLIIGSAISLGRNQAIAQASPKQEIPSRISHQARDLFTAQLLFAPQRLSPFNLAQRQLNREKFCQNYPLNSQCSGITPIESEPASIPISVPQVDINNQNNRGTKTGWAIVPEVSTLGLGGSIVRKITPNFNARVGVNAFNLGIDITETDFDYEGDLNLFNVSTLIDFHPFKSSGLRLTGGLIIGNNNIEGTADVSERVADELGEVELDGETIDIRELEIDDLTTIDADIELYEGAAPYLGIGGGNAVGSGKGLGFWWNLGVVFSGSPNAEVSSNISEDIPAELRQDVEAAADRALEDEEADLEDELDFIRIYPVLSLGLSYQF
ncbi:MAG: hypothetical protein AAFQ41_13025 [Cyanobacteria bacterium J06623_7]